MRQAIFQLIEFQTGRSGQVRKSETRVNRTKNTVPNRAFLSHRFYEKRNTIIKRKDLNIIQKYKAKFNMFL